MTGMEIAALGQLALSIGGALFGGQNKPTDIGQPGGAAKGMLTAPTLQGVAPSPAIQNLFSMADAGRVGAGGAPSRKQSAKPAPAPARVPMMQQPMAAQSSPFAQLYAMMQQQ